MLWAIVHITMKLVLALAMILFTNIIVLSFVLVGKPRGIIRCVLQVQIIITL